MPAPEEGMAAFRARVLARGRELYRDLPWRRDFDPYGIWVSEVMLQQTQVARVDGRWQRWLGRFPTVDALAAASTADVLEEWQGMGYNRRALAMREAARLVAAAGGELPCETDELVALPGVGPATCAGVRAFAYGEKAVYIETNVRAVFIHELFPDRDSVPDKELRPLVEQTCPDARVRDWYYALLDWGAHLKRTTVNPSRRSAHYARQSAFEGSRRQKRAETLRFVLAHPGCTLPEVAARLDEVERAAGRDGVDEELAASIVRDLASEGFFRQEEGRFLP